MILAHHPVELAAGRADEDGIRRQRPDDVRSAFSGVRDRGFDQPALLIAEGARLARMRVQCGDRQPRPLQTVEAAQVGRGQGDSRRNPLDRQRRGYRGQPQMRRNEDHAQAAADEHHAHLRRASKPGQQFSVAGIPVPGRVPHGFADRRGDQPVQVAVHGETDAGVHGVVGRIAAGWRRPARHGSLCVECGNGQDRQPVRVRRIRISHLPSGRPQPRGQTFGRVFDDRPVAQHDRPAGRRRRGPNRLRGTDGDLRADPGSVAQGHADQGSRVHGRAAAARLRTATASPARRSSWEIRAGRARRLPRRRPGPIRFR